MAETVGVEIFGRTYQLRAEKNEDYVRQLAEMVHDKMKEVGQNTNTVDTVRVAILAALNLADEYCILKARNRKRIEALEEERDKLLDLVEGALNEDN